MDLSWIPVFHQLRSVGWLYSESRMLHLWLEILFRVQRSKDTYPVKGVSVEVRPGQFISSTRKLAAAISVDKDTVGRYLKILESQRWIERKVLGNVTLYTVLVMEQIPGFTIKESTGQTAVSDTKTLTVGDTSGDTFGDINYINKNNNINISPSPAREEEFFEIFSRDKEAFRGIALALHCKEEILESMYQDFVQESRVKEKRYGTVLQCKEHFFNWARARLDKEKRDGTTKANKPGGGSQGNKRGRRTPLEPGCGLIED